MNDIVRLAETNGLEFVKNKVIEEAKELIQAIENNDLINTIEEIADVEITKDQLKHLLNIEQKVMDQKQYKIKRTLKKLNLINLKEMK
jgi:phosphoribosyl-ATP pyrophosphohydrolase